MTNPPLYQCPYNMAIQCAMQTGCASCDHFDAAENEAFSADSIFGDLDAILKEVGGTDAAEDWSKGYDAAVDEIEKHIHGLKSDYVTTTKRADQNKK